MRCGRLSGLRQNGTAFQREPEQRACLEALDGDDLIKIVALLFLCGQVEHLASHHAVVAGGARKLERQLSPHPAIGMGGGISDDLERHGQQAVTGQNGGGFIIGNVAGGFAAAQVVVVHCRQVIMHQRIAMDAFQCRADAQRLIMICPEDAGTFGHEERTQPLALGKRRIAHGLGHAWCTGAVQRQQPVEYGFDFVRGFFNAAWNVMARAELLEGNSGLT
jgi:hypothetical protein